MGPRWNQADFVTSGGMRVIAASPKTPVRGLLAKGRGPTKMRSNPNGIQLGSKCGLYQGLAQQTSWFAHKREGFGPPLFDPGLDTVGPCGIEE